MKLSGRNSVYLKVNRRGKEKIVILSVLLISFLLAPFLKNLDMNGKLWSEDQNNLPNDKYEPFGIRTQSSLSEYTGIGATQNVTEYGQGFFQNNEINVTNSENASIIVPDNWEANEILCNVTNIYEYDKIWMNETFDLGYDSFSWSNYTSTVNNSLVTFDWDDDPVGSNDSLYIEYLYNQTNNWKNVDSYWNYTFNLDRDEIPFKDWSINFNYKFITNNTEWFELVPGGTSLYCLIKTNENPSVFKMPKLDSHVNDTWYSDNIDPFNPELYDFDLPGTMSLCFGIEWGNTDFNPTGNFSVYFDNITLELQTIPKPSQINLSITDNTNGEIKQISDLTGYGLGTESFNNNWVGATGGTEHKFSFSTNSSGKIDIYTDFFVNATSSSFTTTEIGIKGSEFCTENETRTVWTMYFPVGIPGSYQTNYIFNVSKPINWNVTHLIDPYGNDKISKVLETSGPGNSTLVIPNEIIVNGRWKIVAESPNYILNTKIWKWNDTSTSWEESTNFETYDVIKINGTIDNDLIPNLKLTNASLLIYYPNGTEWSQAYQELSPDSLGNVEFNNFTLGALNASAGKYILNIRWNNINSSQIGFSSLNFENTHNTILSRANDQDLKVISVFTGSTVLIKVNYTDIDIGVGIIGAYVNYTIDNETVITGDMVYFGNGIYIAEIDTTNWQNGLYNVSISADKPYFTVQYEDQIIQLEVTETTIFNPDSTFINVPWGTNTSIYLTYNVSNNQGISGAIINCDWNLNYWYCYEMGPGNYMLELNTTSKQFEIYTLTINVSKTGYENQEIYISINIREIYTNLTYSQPDPVGFKSNISILVNYGDIDSDNLIPGADILISNKFGTEYWNTDNYFVFMESLGIYRITFNTSIFGSGGTFGIYVTASKSNYANATALINIFIGDISTYLDDIFINGQNKTLDKSIIVPIQSTVNISVKYIEAVTESNIKNATVEILGGSFSDNFTKLPNEYNLNIDTTDLGMGVKILTILAKKNGHTLASSDITIIIRSINTTIDMEEGGNLIQINLDEPYTLKIVLKNEDFGGYINASVAYTWEFGHGELEDLNSDGVYEVTFTNIPEGTFTVTIIASAGYDYNFEPFEITLIVSSPVVSPGPYLSWLIYVLFGGIFGLVIVFTLYQTHYKYSPTVRKSRKIRKKIKKGKTTKPVKDIASREEFIKDYLESNVVTIQLEKKTENGLKEK